MDWLLGFLEQEYEQLPDDLNIRIPDEERSEVDLLPVEGDELWSFVGKKENKQWIWLAQDRQSRQIIGVHVGSHGADDAQKLWESIPQYYKEHGLFYTDQWEAYCSVIPPSKHRSYPKGGGQTNHIERFNNTLRQRVSRLVRKALSFSKKLNNHIGAIKYFICDYNINVLYA
jgi:insertion element IS1 protein InsB